MKQTLQLKLGQQLTMTPQLQQAIKLLQLSTLDLQQEIQQTLESNPLLEVSEDEAEQTSDPVTAESDTTYDEDSAPLSREGPLENLEGEATGQETLDDDWAANMPEELPVDSQWEDALPSASAPSSPTNTAPDTDFESRNSADESLQESLLWQLNLTRLSDLDKAIAVVIIDATDSNGRLTMTVEEIHDYLISENGTSVEVDVEERGRTR